MYIFQNYIFLFNYSIYKNKFFFYIEYIHIAEYIKFGILIYKINDIEEEIETYEQIFFNEKLIKFNLNPIFQNNSIFNINCIKRDYHKLLFTIEKSKKINSGFSEEYNLKTSFLKPPSFYLKREIAQSNERWYFDNIYGNYFCFCRGKSCIYIKTLNNYIFQLCKYYFYLFIIDNNINLYHKTYYLLSDFFQDNIESADAFPIFLQMKKDNLNAYYLTVSSDIYKQFCVNVSNCYNNMKIIYGVNKINGDTLEKYLELFLKLKAVIAAEQYQCFNNLFFNIKYITYIFLGHGVTYIKSYLYKDYLGYNKYDKILLPPNEKFVDLALKAGWNKEDIIQIGLPRWDNYDIYNNKISQYINKKNESSIFIMFTWRKVKKGKNISDLYYKNIENIFNNITINQLLQQNNIYIYFCYHHKFNQKKWIKKSNNIRVINQKDISTLLKNSSLIITDFSSIIFDAIVQKKPYILYIPDGLDKNLKDIYTNDYYETIIKLKNGEIYLYEIFFDLDKVINKIIYSIKNNFILEERKLKFCNEFEFKNNNNKKKNLSVI